MFDLRRFGRLAAVYVAENGRALLWFLAIGIGVHLCCWLLITQVGGGANTYTVDMQAFLYFAGYALTSLLFAARHFAPLSSRESAMTFLMRPASSLEKSLLALLAIAVAYPLAYTLAFQVVNLPGAWLGELAREAMLREAADAQARQVAEALDFGPFLPFTGDLRSTATGNILLAILSLQALVAAGMLYFGRFAWLKTLVAMFVLVVLLLPLVGMLGDAQLDRLFLEPDSGATPLLWALRLATWVGVPLLLWAGAWCLMRERELH